MTLTVVRIAMIALKIPDMQRKFSFIIIILVQFQ